MSVSFHIVTDNYFLCKGIQSSQLHDSCEDITLDVYFINNINSETLEYIRRNGHKTIVIIIECSQLRAWLFSHLNTIKEKIVILMEASRSGVNDKNKLHTNNFISFDNGLFSIYKYQRVRNEDLKLTMEESLIVHKLYKGFNVRDISKILSISEKKVYRIKKRISSRFKYLSCPKSMLLCKEMNAQCHNKKS